MTRLRALALLCCGAVLGGCAATRAPVAEHEVADYRRGGASPPSGAPASPAPATGQPRATSLDKAVGTDGAKAGPPPPKPTTAAAAAAKPPVPASAPRPPAVAAEAAVEEDARPEVYTVKRGDTLYSIALDNGLDYRELAAWNQLADPNVIRVNQQLKLRPPPGWKPEPAESDEVVTRPLAASPTPDSQPLEGPAPVKSEPKGIKVPYSDAALAQLTRDPDKVPVTEAKPPAVEVRAQPKPEPGPTVAASPAPPAAPTPAPAAAAPVAKPETPATAAAKPAAKPEAAAVDGAIAWLWPAAGKVIHGFNQGSNPKGVAIAGVAGQAVVASAAGKVVYSGSGLRGYGKLIIIKHNNTYLSVYAHNRELLVREGERVTRGQKIAEMGSSDSDRVGLHFEIRRFGKPVDPLKYLPAEGA